MAGLPSPITWRNIEQFVFGPNPNAKKPIVYWNDLAPILLYLIAAAKQTASNSNSSVAGGAWFSEVNSIPNVGAGNTLLYNERLKPNSFAKTGDFAMFSYYVKAENNSNAKTVSIQFNGTPLVSYSPPSKYPVDVFISGVLKCTDIAGTLLFIGRAACSVNNSWVYNNERTFVVTVSSLNFSSSNFLSLYGQGVANGDVTAIDGEGVIYQT